MNRRALFAGLAGGSGVAFAGCLDAGSDGTGDGAPYDRNENVSSETRSAVNGDDGTEADGNESRTRTSETDGTD